VPRLDPAPVDLRIDGSDGPEAAAADQARGRLLRLAEEGRWRATEADAAGRCELDQLVSLARTERERLLAVDVAARFQRPLRDLVVGLVDRQVDDDVDRLVPQHVVERRVTAAAVSLCEGGGPRRIQVRGRHQPDLRMGHGVVRIPARDVAGSNDSDAEWRHAWRLRD
jgi:hypothetical protein